METAVKVILGCVGLLCLCLIAGFVDAWWEWRKQEKNKRG